MNFHLKAIQISSEKKDHRQKSHFLEAIHANISIFIGCASCKPSLWLWVLLAQNKIKVCNFFFISTAPFSNILNYIIYSYEEQAIYSLYTSRIYIIRGKLNHSHIIWLFFSSEPTWQATVGSTSSRMQVIKGPNGRPWRNVIVCISRALNSNHHPSITWRTGSTACTSLISTCRSSQSWAFGS